MLMMKYRTEGLNQTAQGCQLLVANLLTLIISLVLTPPFMPKIKPIPAKIRINSLKLIDISGAMNYQQSSPIKTQNPRITWSTFDLTNQRPFERCSIK